jgi:acetyl-CoA synthetase
LLSRRPEVFATALAVWRLGALYVPLYSGFGGDALHSRLADSEPKAIVTDAANRAQLGATDATVIMVDGEGDLQLSELLASAGEPPAVADTKLTDGATLMYTSGSSGRAKGCILPHHAVISLFPYVRHCIDAGPGDVLFSGADPGWSFGLYTTGFAPLALGVTRIVYEGGFAPADWWRTMEAVGATHLATAPTGYRQLAASGPEGIAKGIRVAVSAGEPLDAPTAAWFEDHAGLVLRDSYGLTELGMITGNLRPQDMPGDAVPGSMGIALPGFEVALLDDELTPLEGEVEGRVAVRDNGFWLGAGYWGRMPEWDERLRDGWFITEDIARRDAVGRYTYVSRADDVIVTAGYNVGPIEVETALMDHPLIVDAACIGVPDPRKGQVIAAFVVLDGEPPEDLLADLRPWVGDRVGWHAAPRRVEVVDELPRTASGKVLRGALRRAVV